MESNSSRSDFDGAGDNNYHIRNSQVMIERPSDSETDFIITPRECYLRAAPSSNPYKRGNSNNTNVFKNN